MAKYHMSNAPATAVSSRTQDNMSQEDEANMLASWPGRTARTAQFLLWHTRDNPRHMTAGKNVA